MSDNAIELLNKHINTETILSNIKNPALVVGVSGEVARVNNRCSKLLPELTEGVNLSDVFSEKGVFGSFTKMIRHGLSVSGLHPCNITSKSPEMSNQSRFLGYFAMLRSQITHRPIAILLHVDEQNSKRERFIRLQQALSQRVSVLRQLHKDGLHDPLTKLKNRRFMDSFLAMECDLNKRQLQQGSLAVIDIDYFKHVNDTFGHTTGDRVIKIVADVIRERLRDSDVSCRWGGEEFAVYLHNTTGVDAITLAEELRILVQGRKIVEQGKTIRVTVSLGITTITHNDTPTSLFSRADSALYKAKQQGRNQVYVEFA